MNRGINQHATYSENPFRVDGKNIVFKNRISDGITVGKDYYDIQKYSVRVFPELLDDLMDLSAMSIKLLVYIFSELRKNTDSVYIDMDSFFRFVKDKTGADIKSKAGVYRGLEELIRKGVIARMARENRKFFINPAKFYVGSRVEFFFKTFVKEEETVNEQI